jgi:S-adenosylhomocysteine hydrolase
MLVSQLLKNKKLYRSLPLLEYAKGLFPAESLKGVTLVCAQHLVSTTYTLFHHLFDLGLEPENLHVIGKCYSTDKNVVRQLSEEGVNVSPLSTYFDSHESYDDRYSWNVSQFFSESISKLRKPQKLIFLDDGGHLLKIANERLPDTALVSGVEQTSAGYILLKDSRLSFPIVNVARSRAKLHYESPIIAQLVCDRLFSFLNNLLHLKPRIMIIGYGFIGKAIHRKLQKINEISHIDIYDPYKKSSTFSESELNKHIGDYDIIIGCSGKTVLSETHYPCLKRPVYLVSASSSDREFDAVKLRYAHKKTYNPHECLNIRGINLVNCGFPYPFDSCYDEIDLPQFQLTRSLLLSAVVQASTVNLRKTGFLSLHSELQEKILRKYQDLGEGK